MGYALVILCGGNSTRMGSDKALLPFGDYCLLEYLVLKFQPYFSKIYLSVKKKGDYTHLNLSVTEIPDIYPNAGPMSGIFSGLSMMDEEKAFFMSVDTPFLDPDTGIALLETMGDADICTIRGKASYLETATASYSRNCITTVGKCLLLHQFTFQTLREKCQTKYLTEKTIAKYTKTPVDIQFYNLDTRQDYYHALSMLNGISHPDSTKAFIEYFNDNQDLFAYHVPTLSFVSKPGTTLAPFMDLLIPLLNRDGLHTLFLSREDHSVILRYIDFEPTLERLKESFTSSDLILLENFGMDSPNKIEVLRKKWSEEPVTDPSELLAILTDFPCQTNYGIPVFDMNRPKSFLNFIHDFISHSL